MKIVFVCTGNICRSPTAEGVFRALVEREGLAGEIDVDSAGTHGYHVGDPPDPRTCEAAALRGYDLWDQRARRFDPLDFERYDLVIAMDRGHYRDLSGMAPPTRENRLRLFLDFAPGTGRKDVPDPYYGGQDGFELVLDLIESGSQGLLRHIRSEHLDTRADTEMDRAE